MQAKSSRETVWVAQDSKILKSTQVFLSVSVAYVAYRRSKAERTQRKETETIFIHCMTEKLLDAQIFQVHQQILFILVQASIHQLSTNSEELMNGLEYQNLRDNCALVLFLHSSWDFISETSVLALSTNKTANSSCFTGLLGLSVRNISGLSYRGESVPKESTTISQN